MDSVELELGISVLPADSDVKLMTVFAGMEGRPWTSITALRAAVRAWHVERGCLAVMERAWTDRAFQFWAGLKKSADHTRAHAKRPLSREELVVYQNARVSCGTLAGARDAAMAAAAFYGIRRSAEVLALTMADVIDRGDHFELRITRQKNDPLGQGMLCWIPAEPRLGAACPAILLRAWLRSRKSMWDTAAESPFFCVTGAATPRPVSADSFRRSIAACFPGSAVGTHSLRKGGAHWWKVRCGLADEIVQAQGGWASAEVMRSFYARFSDQERRDILLSSSARGCLTTPAPAAVTPAGGASAAAISDIPPSRRPV